MKTIMDKVKIMVDNIVSSYKNFKISHITFKLKNGDFLGMIGRSGSGKSTLLKTLIGLKKPSSGKIQVLLNDKNVPINKIMGYSPQSNSLYPYLTVEENLWTFGRIHNLNNSEIKKKSDELLEHLRLTEARKKKIIQLSGGMQKRADLAVTLIHSPQLLILDEPFIGLDIEIGRAHV